MDLSRRGPAAATRSKVGLATTGAYKRHWGAYGKPPGNIFVSVCVSGGPGPKNPGKHYLYVSNSWPDSAPAAAAEFTGEVYKMELNGTIVGKFGKAGKAVGEFATIHRMDCVDADGEQQRKEMRPPRR